MQKPIPTPLSRILAALNVLEKLCVKFFIRSERCAFQSLKDGSQINKAPASGIAQHGQCASDVQAQVACNLPTITIVDQ